MTSTPPARPHSIWLSLLTAMFLSAQQACSSCAADPLLVLHRTTSTVALTPPATPHVTRLRMLVTTLVNAPQAFRISASGPSRWCFMTFTKASTPPASPILTLFSMLTATFQRSPHSTSSSSAGSSSHCLTSSTRVLTPLGTSPNLTWFSELNVRFKSAHNACFRSATGILLR